MLTIQIVGTVTDIFPIEHITEHFSKRVFWIRTNDEDNPQDFGLELLGRDMEKLNHLKIGEPINITAELRGKKWKKNGREGIITTLRATIIEKINGEDLPF